jgi:hypothetical protein
MYKTVLKPLNFIYCYVVKIHILRTYIWVWDEIKTLTGACLARHIKSRTRDGGRRRAVLMLRHNHETSQRLEPDFQPPRVVGLSNGRIAVAC